MGAFLAGILTKSIGRKSTLLAIAFIYLVGGLMKASAMGITMLAAGRFISGIAAGCGAVVCPIIIMELAPPASKGKLWGPQLLSFFKWFMAYISCLIVELSRKSRLILGFSQPKFSVSSSVSQFHISSATTVLRISSPNILACGYRQAKTVETCPSHRRTLRGGTSRPFNNGSGIACLPLQGRQKRRSSEGLD